MSAPRDREPAPVTYVPLPAGARVPGPPLDKRSHDRLDPKALTGRLDLRIVTVDPVHVGSGVTNFFADELARDIVVQRRGNGDVPVFPGSSFKGAVRSVAEAIGGGCDLANPCQPTCAVCAIFGHLMSGGGREGGYLARAGFSDAYPEDPDQAAKKIGAIRRPVAFQPRVRKGRRIYRAADVTGEAPVPYVVVDRGVPFRGDLSFRNLALAELGLVLLSAGCDGSFHLRIGGGKFASLGRVAVTSIGGALREGYESLSPNQLDEPAARDLAARAIAAALPPANAEALRVVRATLGGRP